MARDAKMSDQVRFTFLKDHLQCREINMVRAKMVQGRKTEITAVVSTKFVSVQIYSYVCG